MNIEDFADLKVRVYHVLYAITIILAVVGLFFTGVWQMWLFATASFLLLLGSMAQRDQSMDADVHAPDTRSGGSGFLFAAMLLAATKATPPDFWFGKRVVMLAIVLFVFAIAMALAVILFTGDRLKREAVSQYLWRVLSSGGFFIALSILVAFSS